MTGRPTTLPRARLLSKIVIDETSGCWLWQGWINEHGYGRFYTGGSSGRTIQAHRAAYELFIGPIPDGMTLDHVKARGCVHRHCVNPAHLEPVTMRENLMRGYTLAAHNIAKTHCPSDHAYDDENTYVYTQGWRACRRCIRDRARLRMRAVRAEQRAERLKGGKTGSPSRLAGAREAVVA